MDAWEHWICRADPVIDLPREHRVLLISYQFPPVGGSGVQRPAKLAACLPGCGWDVEVLTADHARFAWHDPTLLQDLPDTVRVHRFSGYEPACVARRAVSCLRFRSHAARQWVEDRLYWRLARWAGRCSGGNGESWWVRPAISAAHALNRRNPFDAVISTGPPHFVHAVALAFARGARIPWMADLRDPLVSDFDRTPASAVHQQTQRRFERLLLRHADAVITTCEAFAEDLQTRFPARSGAIRCIPNGFDRRDLRTHLVRAGRAADRRCCRLLASGSFYGRRELHRVLGPLSAALARHPEWAGRVELRLVGTVDARQRRELEHQRPEWLIVEGYVSHQEAIARAFEADCSLVLVPDCAHGRMSIPAKTFELLALPRHILGLVPPGSECERILGRAGACTLAPLEDERAVSGAFERILRNHFAGTLTSRRNWQQIDAYDRRHIAGQFAAVLHEICSPHAQEWSPIDAADPGAELILDRPGPTPRKSRRRKPDLDLDVLGVT